MINNIKIVNDKNLRNYYFTNRIYRPLNNLSPNINSVITISKTG